MFVTDRQDRAGIFQICDLNAQPLEHGPGALTTLVTLDVL